MVGRRKGKKEGEPLPEGFLFYRNRREGLYLMFMGKNHLEIRGVSHIKKQQVNWGAERGEGKKFYTLLEQRT